MPLTHELCEQAALEAFNDKWFRRNYLAMAEKYGGVTRAELQTAARVADMGPRLEVVHGIALEMEQRIDDLLDGSANDLDLDPVHTFPRIDGISMKLRQLSDCCPLHQCFGHLAYLGLRPLLRARLLPYQFASIPKKGQTALKRQVERWLRRKSLGIQHALKLDVKGAYEHTKQELVLAILQYEIPLAAWLLAVVRCLLAMSPNGGLLIGGYLEAWMFNLVASYMGIYFYCYDQSADAAATTAEQVVKAISGHKFDYPIYYDVEYEPFNKACGKATNTTIIKSALGVLEQAGYYAAVYCSRDFFLNYTNLSALSGFDKWEAAYTATDTAAVKNGLWQYSSTNALGIKGFGAKLDCDVSYVDYPAIMHAKGLNGYPKPSTDTKPAESATPLQCPTVGPMSKGDFDTILAAAGHVPTAYTVTFPPMTTAAASVLQQKAHGLSVGYSSAWAEG